jgi:hypothetical protein
MAYSMTTLRVKQGMLRTLCILLLPLTWGALSAQNQDHRVSEWLRL